MTALKSKATGRGRKEILLKKDRRVSLSVSEPELAQLKRACKEAGMNTVAGYLREKFGLEGKVKPAEFLKNLDEIGKELKAISDNMNRVARHVDRLSVREDMDTRPIGEFNLLMDRYMATRRDLVKVYRTVVRMI